MNSLVSSWAGMRAQTSGGDELQVPVHVVIPGHLHSLRARDRFDHRQRLGAGGPAGVEQGTYDALPPACFHVFDGGIEVGLQLMQMTAQVPQHAIRRDRIPVGPLDLDDDKHLLITVHLNGQIDASPATPDKPPLTFPEPPCPGDPDPGANPYDRYQTWASADPGIQHINVPDRCPRRVGNCHVARFSYDRRRDVA